MARSTSSKSPKAKSTATRTKPAAKKAVKEVKKTSSKTVKTAPVVPAKTVKEVAVVKRQPRRSQFALTFENVRNMHLASAVVFGVLAVLAVTLMDSTSLQVFRGHLASDALANGQGTVFAPAQHAIMDVSVKWAVAGTLAASAVFSTWRYLAWRKVAVRVKANMQRRIAPMRWVDLAITGALVIEVVALLSGVQDMVALKLLGGFVAVTAVFSWIAERENSGAARVVRGSFVAAFASYAVVLLSLNAYAVATYVYGMIRSPWYVYALYGVIALGGLLLAVNQLRTYKQVGKWADYLYAERNYSLINLLTKTAFGVILIVGLLK